MGSVPNADHDLLCSFNENSLICLYCSAETPFTTAFPTTPDDATSMIIMYLHAVLGLFQKALSMMEERFSPLRALVIAPSERKECIEKSAFLPAACAWLFKVFVISAADMGILPRMGAPPSALREMLGNKYPRVISQPMTDPMATSCSTAVTGHVAKHSWLYATANKVVGPTLHGLAPLEIKKKPTEIREPKDASV